uniref:Uncharacterized protein n=1 Tax=Tanacetum cinerariifolium TaxID=118510 RepID=A0A6L2NVE8_TANCI|nr:hypothetical protein [Tanacetum cinerariifolium]
MTLLNTLLETNATLTKQVANLEQDKIAQAIKITKLKQRVRRLEKKRQFKSSGLKRLRKVGTTQRVESSAGTVIDDQEDGRLVESQAKVYHLDLEHAKKVFSMQDTDEAEPTEVEEMIEVVTAAKLMTEVVTTTATTIIVAQVPKASDLLRRRGVVIQDPKETATASVFMHSEDESFARQLEAELNSNINWDDVIEQVKTREKQDNKVMRYQALKRKPVTEAQARENMMIYLKNTARFKMDFFKEEEGNKRKGDSLNQYAIKKQRIDEETEKLKTHLQIVANDDDDVYTEPTHLALKVSVVDYQIHHEHSKPYYKIIKADGTYQLFLSFIPLLNNFDREDLEMLWKLVQERFQSLEPKNFSDDFLQNTFKIMYEKTNVEASIWRDQKARYGLAKVKS